MEVENIAFGDLKCQYCGNTHTGRVGYILYPMSISPDWIRATADAYGASVVVISGIDWDNALTPWPAAGVPKGSPAFGGLASEFLSKLTGEIVPAVEACIGFSRAPERTLIGVSLSGLFALWQWPRNSFFHSIATLSGSFWYEDFVRWVETQPFSGKTGRCFMLLGDAEPHSNNPIFATVGKCTADIVGYLRRQGVDITYKVVRGNHYQYPEERLNMAVSVMWR